MRTAATVLGLLTFASLTACGGDARPTPRADPAGRTYISTSVEGTPFPAVGRSLLEFTDPGRSPSRPDATSGNAESTCPTARS